jgi:catechol 2,3-dioxygenase-like lactoylglutathione lyase family enzyme
MIDDRPTQDKKDSSIERRDFLVAFASSFLSPIAAIAQPSLKDSMPVKVTSLNHASFSVADLKAGIQWYGRVFGMPLYGFQDYGAGQNILRVGTKNEPAYIALNQADQRTVAQAKPSRPHFCYGVRDFDVDRIQRALSEMPAFAQSTLREGKTVNGINFTDLNDFRTQFNPHIACGGNGFWGEVCDFSAKVEREPGWAPPIPVQTFNNVRMVVPSIRQTVTWYTKLTDMKEHTFQQRTGGPRTILLIGKGPQHVQLVEGTGPETFQAHLGFGVPGFDADVVMQRLRDHKVMARMNVRDGVTKEILVEGPYGVEIQLQDVSYCGGGGPLGNIM